MLDAVPYIMEQVTLNKFNKELNDRDDLST